MSEDILDEVYGLDRAPLEGSGDVLMHEESPSLGGNNILPYFTYLFLTLSFP